MHKTTTRCLILLTAWQGYSQAPELAPQTNLVDIFTPRNVPKLEASLSKIKSELIEVLNKEPRQLEISEKHWRLTFSSNTKQYAKTVSTRPKGKGPVKVIDITGPFNNGFILDLVFRAYNYPDQMVSPQVFEEPYGHKSYFIIRPPHQGFEVAVYYDSCLESPVNEHQIRLRKARTIIESVLNEP